MGWISVKDVIDFILDYSGTKHDFVEKINIYWE